MNYFFGVLLLMHLVILVPIILEDDLGRNTDPDIMTSSGFRPCSSSGNTIYRRDVYGLGTGVRICQCRNLFVKLYPGLIFLRISCDISGEPGTRLLYF